MGGYIEKEKVKLQFADCRLFQKQSSWIMKPENIVKVFSVLKWVSCLGLLVGSVFFVKDITQKYLRKDSTFISYTVPANRLKHPTFVICFNPYIKKSMLTQFNLTYYDV